MNKTKEELIEYLDEAFRELKFIIKKDYDNIKVKTRIYTVDLIETPINIRIIIGTDRPKELDESLAPQVESNEW